MLRADAAAALLALAALATFATCPARAADAPLFQRDEALDPWYVPGRLNLPAPKAAEARARLLCMFPCGGQPSTAFYSGDGDGDGGGGDRESMDFVVRLATALAAEHLCDGVRLYYVKDAGSGAPASAGAEGDVLRYTDRISVVWLPLLHADESYDNHYEKIYTMLGSAFVEDLEAYDWFVKVDTDSVFFPENLRHFLRERRYSARDAVVLGSLGHFRRIAFPLGAAYALSREALRRSGPIWLALRFMPRHEAADCECVDARTQGEEPFVAACLSAAGAYAFDMEDERGASRFLPFQLKDHYSEMRYSADPQDWWWKGKKAGADLDGAIARFPIVAHNYKGGVYSESSAADIAEALGALREGRAGAALPLDEILPVVHPDRYGKGGSARAAA